MLRDAYPYFLAGRPAQPNADLIVSNKYTGEPATRVALAGAAEIDRAMGAAESARTACRRLPAFKRAEILHHCVRRLTERHEELAQILTIEAGKPIRDARGEVTRGIDTFRLAAEAATQIHGEYAPLDISARAAGYESIVKRVPIGVCSFISPFNFPINLAAHKIAPAIAAGCPWVLKPASLTPVSAIVLAEILAETEWPADAYSVLPCRREGADLFTTDPRPRLLSFTGSPEVGWALKARSGKKRVILELGGNAACVVDRDADIEYAVSRITLGAFYQSGQSCIGVQRVFIHAAIYDDVKARLIAAANALVAGDPADEATSLGPLITEDEARRVASWVDAAVAQGGRILCGGKRDGPFYAATLVEHVPDACELSCEEVFGPVAILEPFSSFKKVCERVNASRFGLQAGLFTRDLHRAFYAFNELEVGGVILNDIPSFRVDSMPYGGVKDSGLGREGIRCAIEDMTEPRLMVLNRAGEGVDG